MAQNFDWYQKQTTDNLLLLKEDASNELFKLQAKPIGRKVKYWTSVYAMINSILNARANDQNK